MTLILISILLSLSLAMGSFSVSQLQYQDRGSSPEMFARGIVAFLKGFLLWPYFFPMGLKRGKYQMKVVHKVGTKSFLP